MRRRARTDRNQAEIIARFRAYPGVDVVDLSAVGQGCPDLLVGTCGVNVLVEVKDGTKPPSKRVLTPEQERFHELWQGWVCTVINLEDVDQIVAYVRQRHAKRYTDAISPPQSADKGLPLG